MQDTNETLTVQALTAVVYYCGFNAVYQLIKLPLRQATADVRCSR